MEVITVGGRGMRAFWRRVPRGWLPLAVRSSSTYRLYLIHIIMKWVVINPGGSGVILVPYRTRRWVTGEFRFFLSRQLDIRFLVMFEENSVRRAMNAFELAIQFDFKHNSIVFVFLFLKKWATGRALKDKSIDGYGLLSEKYFGLILIPWGIRLSPRRNGSRHWNGHINDKRKSITYLRTLDKQWIHIVGGTLTECPFEMVELWCG